MTLQAIKIEDPESPLTLVGMLPLAFVTFLSSQGNRGRSILQEREK